MFVFIIQAINDIIACGPGTPKIIPKNSVEAKCEYIFHLKFGGFAVSSNGLFPCINVSSSGTIMSCVVYCP